MVGDGDEVLPVVLLATEEDAEEVDEAALEFAYASILELPQTIVVLQLSC